ncbi:MAG: GH3 auxin-responsive promoter family protein [Minwuia sp.]|uniref:GH3 family domain-containing protein n=1 Tax=Minwuia sp. TaxID=2493630 RepID=UPI003A84434B
MLSAFGEHLIGSEIEQAVHEAAGKQSIDIVEFTVGPVLNGGSGGRGGHVYLVEARGEPDAAQLAADIDETLNRTNDDYAAHRGGGTGMDAPVLRLMPPGAFERWMEMKGKAGGQHKVPRVIADASKYATMLEEFEEIAGGV